MRQLDLGCGANPRNPFIAGEIYDIHISEREFSKAIEDLKFEFKEGNLVIDPIPLPNNYFD